MHPVSRKCFSCDRFSLSYFILMMREYEINSSHMDIDLFTMSPEITGTTFYVPPWTSFESTWTIFGFKMSFPEIFSISGIVSFPESEITDAFFLILILFDSSSGLHAFHVEMSQITVFFETLDVEIYGPIITHISMFCIDEFLGHAYHLRDKL